MLKAVALAPENLTYRYNLAILLNKQKKLEEAIQNYKKAIEINPKYDQAFFNLALALRQQGK